MIHRKNALFPLLSLSLCLLSSLLSPPCSAAELADLSRFPQSASAYLPENPDEPIMSYENQKIYADEYLRNFFAPWQSADLSYLDLTEEKIASLQKGAGKRTLFTADGKPFPKAKMSALLANADVPFADVNRPGIALTDADVRVLPTSRALFPSANSARGALGMLRQDALQNSTLKPGEPLRILHRSKDAAWVFVATGAVVGWVASGRIALVDADFIDRWMYSDHAVFVRDNVRIAGGDGRPAAVAKMGTILPCDGGTLYLPRRDESGRTAIKAYRPEADLAVPFPLPFTPRSALSAVDQMMGEPYGWGGSFGFRDCSAMTRDYFSIFGVWLPRNSGDQAKAGAAIPLKNVPVGERLYLIAERGIPFASLIQMPGHIMLYLGVYDGEPVVFHNVWGVRTNMPDGKTGRSVVGRAAATSLYLGSEISNRPKGSLLVDNITALSFPVANIW